MRNDRKGKYLWVDFEFFDWTKEESQRNMISSAQITRLLHQNVIKEYDFKLEPVKLRKTSKRKVPRNLKMLK